MQGQFMVGVLWTLLLQQDSILMQGQFMVRVSWRQAQVMLVVSQQHRVLLMLMLMLVLWGHGLASRCSVTANL
jgi:hypothetical protein